MNPTPPLDMQSPELAYQVFYVIFAVQLVAALGWLVWHSTRNRTRLPLIAFAGSLVVGYFVLPLFNYSLLTWFPSNIPGSYITAFGMRDPLFDFVGYTLYFGLGGYIVMRSLQQTRSSSACRLLSGITVSSQQ